MSEKVKTCLAAVLVFAAAILSRDILFGWSWYADLIEMLPVGIGWLEQPVRWLFFVWLGLFLVPNDRQRSVSDRLGLRISAIPALIFSFIACSPMLIGPLLWGKLNSELVLLSLVFSAVVWPLAEEVLFRGYFFRQLHQNGGVPFWSAAVLSGATFGLLHLGQASVQQLSLSGEIGTVLLIGVGGIFYAWLFVKWEFNLWVPFGMHMFMNGWWEVFEMASNPLGGWVPNVLRVITVGLAISITLFRGRFQVFSQRLD